MAKRQQQVESTDPVLESDPIAMDVHGDGPTDGEIRANLAAATKDVAAAFADAPTPYVGMDAVYTLEPKASPLRHGQKRAAKVTHVWPDGTVSLAVFVGDPRDFQPKEDARPPMAANGFVLGVVSVFGKKFDANGAEDTWTTPQ